MRPKAEPSSQTAPGTGSGWAVAGEWFFPLSIISGASPMRKKRGVEIVSPIKGHLVCIEEGMGHLAENSSILSAVIDACKIR